MTRENNFDLIRLLAAIQVIFQHATESFNASQLSTFWQHIIFLITRISGVPVFFVISGFLISASFERNSHLTQYARNRFLRIYPALWAALALAIILIVSFGFVNAQTLPHLFSWIALQASFFQFYNPHFLRGFGTGKVNGSLWTISVELQFYIALPVIYWLSKKITPKKQDITLWTIFILSIALSTWFTRLPHPTAHINTANLTANSTLLYKLFDQSIFPHLYLFFMGIMIRRHWGLVSKLLEGKALIWCAIFIVAYLTIGKSILLSSNVPTPTAAIIIAFLTISLAYTKVGASNFLKGNDYSYGIYIYHMLAINVLLEIGLVNIQSAILPTLLISGILAWSSWKFLEKPCLKLKKNPYHKIKEGS